MMGRVGLTCNGIGYYCDIEDDELYLKWLSQKLREILTPGLSPATQLKFTYQPNPYREAEKVMG